jgi:hypothetical protein
MFYTDSALKRYYIGKPFEYNGNRYTVAGATHANFISLGFKQVIPQPRPDRAYYIVSGPDSSGKYDATPRQLEDSVDSEGNVAHGLKWNKKQESWLQSEKLLGMTDWWVTYQTEYESSLADPETCKKMEEYRALIRFVQLTRETMIDACSSVDELKALMKAQPEIADPEAGDGSMIPNPNPYLPEFPPAPDYDTSILIGKGITGYGEALVATLAESSYATELQECLTCQAKMIAPEPAKTKSAKKSSK